MAFTFVQITDHHLGAREDTLMHGYNPAQALRAVLRHIAEHEQFDFLVSTGDLVDRADSYHTFCQLFQLRPAAAAPGPALVTIEGLRDCPMYFLPGNHDDRENFYAHLFSRTTPPDTLMHVAFQHKGIQFLCLDWGPGGVAKAHPEMIAFLESSLSTGLPCVIFTHHHLVPTGDPFMDSFLPIPEEAQAFWKMVEQNQKHVLGIFSGHAHVTYETVAAGIPTYGLRSTSYQFATLKNEVVRLLQAPHYRVVTIDQGTITARIVETEI
ncbi:metallophosphoesterase [Dictyobacter arantiisoli]|uniref:3',5'-cyclic adenosine monophosphate phosphodiesterase CpdA n=1 Tax=Dictyobacter arantiisoli TaxID=2014874 RepID=A0A5A5T7S8_9CHLR|nr:metallophosphoesterase [Dictyobacter arantiisoli]GCF07009.1 3',5'-cyclic adenosine monophosphate phosphodiesterase CpdA [Dictyobacter arantiisoli]